MTSPCWAAHRSSRKSACVDRLLTGPCLHLFQQALLHLLYLLCFCTFGSWMTVTLS